jgi:hypothetical protein
MFPDRFESRFSVSIKKQVEFDIQNRTFRINVQLNNTYDVHGFNSLREQVGIYTDLNSEEKVFVSWGLIPVLRFIDQPEDGDA